MYEEIISFVKQRLIFSLEIYFRNELSNCVKYIDMCLTESFESLLLKKNVKHTPLVELMY